jgi:hypothetical protein
MKNMELLQSSKAKQRSELQSIVSSGSLPLQVQELQEKVRGQGRASVSRRHR